MEKITLLITFLIYCVMIKAQSTDTIKSEDNIVSAKRYQLYVV